MKNRNKIASVCLMLGMVLLVTGISYAFFVYYKTGLYTHTITGAKMKVIYDEKAGNNILIENAYPRTDDEALTYGLEFELKELDLSSFNTSQVTDMNRMFSGSGIINLDLSSFDTSKITDMSYMFSYASLRELDVSSFELTKYFWTFYGVSDNCKVYVKNETIKTNILNTDTKYRPAWTTDNIIVKNV